jgi:hypothetical protein
MRLIAKRHIWQLIDRGIQQCADCSLYRCWAGDDPKPTRGELVEYSGPKGFVLGCRRHGLATEMPCKSRQWVVGQEMKLR